MRAYGAHKRSNKIHPHNECGICCAWPTRNGSKRMKLKKELEREIMDIPYHSTDE